MTTQTKTGMDTIRDVKLFNGLDMGTLALLHRAGARKEDLVRLFVRHGAEVEYLGRDSIRLHVAEDNWLLRLQGGVPALYHNDYVIRDDGTRTLLDTYHRQPDGGDGSFSNLVRILCGYSFERHMEAARRYEARAAAARLEGLLAITDNYADAGWRSVFFRWYTFVDIAHRADRGARRFGVGVKEEMRTEYGDLALVTCRVFRPFTGRFVRLMRWLKSAALRDGRQDYADLCQQKLPQVA